MWNGRACTVTHRGPSRYTLNVLFLLAYDYLECERVSGTRCERMGSYGSCRAWSILTMPAILRKSLPELLASLVVIGSYASVGIIVSHGGGRWGA